ncbi:hypothetical protein BJY01DRAFT_254237 [Aspergillus pseudoustus]|uniref:CsbD-like domain-containing protein n=1 Tax=Aspergillus pseudoustus TaxID=1810923 RepID=A0ABR4IV23_9EURO
MEKQQTTDYKAPEATGPRVDNPTGDGLDRDRAYDSGFKYQIPEAGGAGYNNQATGPGYQQNASFGDDTPTNTGKSQGGNMGERVGSGVRGVFAGIHGAGEWLRGGINAAIDRTFGSEEGVTRNEAIARAGQQEISSGRFSRDSHEGAWNNSKRG